MMQFVEIISTEIDQSLRGEKYLFVLYTFYSQPTTEESIEPK